MIRSMPDGPAVTETPKTPILLQPTHRVRLSLGTAGRLRPFDGRRAHVGPPSDPMCCAGRPRKGCKISETIGAYGAYDLSDVLADACGGDETAFRTLWETFQPRIVRFLRARGAGSPDDIAAETWLLVARELPSFSGTAAQFAGWLFTIARNQLIDAARYQARQPFIAGDLANLPEQAAPDDPARDAVDSLSLNRVIGLVRCLPPDQAEAVALRAIAGLGVRETALVLGKSEGAVRVATHRGLRKLATQLTDGRQGVTR